MQSSSRLEHFPISFFAMIMGLAGLSIAWEKAQSSLNLPFQIDSALAPFTGLVFILLLGLYGFKLARHPGWGRKASSGREDAPTARG